MTKERELEWSDSDLNESEGVLPSDLDDDEGISPESDNVPLFLGGSHDLPSAALTATKNATSLPVKTLLREMMDLSLLMKTVCDEGGRFETEANAEVEMIPGQEQTPDPLGNLQEFRKHPAPIKKWAPNPLLASFFLNLTLFLSALQGHFSACSTGFKSLTVEELREVRSIERWMMFQQKRLRRWSVHPPQWKVPSWEAIASPPSKKPEDDKVWVAKKLLSLAERDERTNLKRAPSVLGRIEFLRTDIWPEITVGNPFGEKPTSENLDSAITPIPPTGVTSENLHDISSVENSLQD